MFYGVTPDGGNPMPPSPRPVGARPVCPAPRGGIIAPGRRQIAAEGAERRKPLKLPQRTQLNLALSFLRLIAEAEWHKLEPVKQEHAAA
jgi:hypothetical protein